MSFLSPVHIAFFAAIALLALGPKRFPEFTKTLGNAMREFREVMSAVPGRERLGPSDRQPDGSAAPAAPAPVGAAAAAPGVAPAAGAPPAAVSAAGLDGAPPAP
jgi:Sec-independent protein translocase protein TatA